MILDTIHKFIEVTVDAMATDEEGHIVVEYADLSTAFAPKSVDTITNGTTPVVVVGSPKKNVQRKVEEISIFNADSVEHDYVVRYVNGVTKRTLWVETLQPTETLLYNKTKGWFVKAAEEVGAPGGSPGGSAGDVQLNDGAGGFTGSGNVNYDPSSGLDIHIPDDSTEVISLFRDDISETIAMMTIALGNNFVALAFGEGQSFENEIRSNNTSFSSSQKRMQAPSFACTTGALLMMSFEDFVDQAGGSEGTLGNSPSAGNPTKWILIDDNGVQRAFPTWEVP